MGAFLIWCGCMMARTGVFLEPTPFSLFPGPVVFSSIYRSMCICGCLFSGGREWRGKRGWGCWIYYAMRWVGCGRDYHHGGSDVEGYCCARGAFTDIMVWLGVVCEVSREYMVVEGSCKNTVKMAWARTSHASPPLLNYILST
ncbi:hypothetical protein K458DRAFT_33010 [Lentithecium fluviatile CBS 122367]|uniref:Secreted protein n=1 Tax=Lentithecium fluviatile CBS 122367 TaxID=1168545 RepID=A0A6G1J1Y2_9PLEO|nr:hypothetical protein K458DRAFT_33010 [Lentithecium fluviatile CBS 122367]